MLKTLFYQLIYLEKMKSQKNKAFTLVELMITATIFSVVSIAIYATFNSGMSVWRRAKDNNAKQHKFMLRAEKLSRELRQTFIFKDIAFKAKNNEIQFPSVIDADICRITYFFDENQKMLLRGSDKLADIIAAMEENKQVETKLFSYLSDVNSVNFSYLVFDLQKNAYVWKEDWQQTTLPIAVKLSIIAKDKTYATTIIIPTV